MSSVIICSFSLSFWQFLTVFSVFHCIFSFYVASGVTVNIVTTVSKGNTVSILNFICILWHYFVISNYLQFLTQILAISHNFFCTFYLWVVSHYLFLVSHPSFWIFSLSVWQFLTNFWIVSQLVLAVSQAVYGFIYVGTDFLRISECVIDFRTDYHKYFCKKFVV